jgi:hypothetical protein
VDSATAVLSLESLIAVVIGIGLAAATGFRVFLPLLVAGLAARWGDLPLADGFQWLSTTGALVALGTASVIEVAGYYIPVVDHALDLFAGPAAIAAGIIASASVMADIPPEVKWPVAIVGGGGIAGLTKIMSALVRAKSALVTGGFANPVVSTGETAGALVVAVAAIVIPVLGLLGVLALLVWVGRRARRAARRSSYIASPGAPASQQLPGPGGPGRL